MRSSLSWASTAFPKAPVSPSPLALHVHYAHTRLDWDGRMAEQTTVRALISIRDQAEHMRRRKPWNRALSIAAIKDYKGILGSRVHEIVTELESVTSDPINFTEWINRFT